MVSVAFGVPAIAVDTHVERVSKRLGICRWKDSVLEVEKTLMRKVPKKTGPLRITGLFSSADITVKPNLRAVRSVRCFLCAEKGRRGIKKDW